MNEFVKEIGEMIPSLHTPFSQTYTKEGNKVTVTNPKWHLISTHTARRSFATDGYLAGTPPLTIMAITGHKQRNLSSETCVFHHPTMQRF